MCLFKTGLGSLEEDHDGEREPSRIDMEFGDYDLLEEIGRGGQGVVYRARQKSLNRTVALKVIGLGRWSSTPHLKRFRHEAEAAASLEHPQIVPIYEIGERDGSCYFSMKFVEGGCLDEVARREPMSTRGAVELLVKVARTVQFAHERGILHRDIKPGNILLDDNGEPHLTDFGLARLIEQESTITNSFEVLGTPSYMPPEQAAGRTKELTPAADVYSLGAVFYQLLTGEPPFAGGTTYETIRLVLEFEPRNPRTRNAKLDVDIATICLKCLQKEPAKRYPTAKALADDLERWLHHEPIEARRSGVVSRARKWVRRNPTVTILAVVISVLAIAAGIMLWRTFGERLPQSGIAVLPFTNLSNDTSDVSFVDGMQDDILTKLAKIGGLKVISRTSVMQYRGERNVRKIGRALGVSHILEGSMRNGDGRIRVNAQLIDTRTDAHLWAETYDREKSDLFAIESALVQQVANRLSAKISSAEKNAIETKPTHDMEAYDLYLRAKRILYSASVLDPDLSQEYTAAIDLLEKAVARDPGFALAYCALAEANLARYWVPDKRQEYRAGAETALQTAMRLAPDAGETHLARALFFYWGNLDYDRALEELEIAARLLPNSAQVFRLSSFVERRMGRWRECLRHSAKAVELDPRDVVQRQDLIRNYIFVRRYTDAVHLSDRAIADFPDSADQFRLQKGEALLDQGDLRGARAAVEVYPSSGPTTVEKFLLWFNILLYERNYDEAERLIATRLDLIHREDLVPDSYFTGVIARATNDPAKARAAFTDCRHALEIQLHEKPNIAIWIATLGLVDAALSNKNDALDENRRAWEMTDSLDRSQFVLDLANIYCWLNDRERALDELEKVAKTEIGVNYGDLRFNPAWDLLRDDPRFAEILAEAAKPIRPK